MSRPQAYALAVMVAVGILAAGTVYVMMREPTYRSTGSMVLVPRGDVATGELPSLVGSFNNSGAIGTYVELIDSADIQERAGSPPVEITVRAIPASRVITVSATGARQQVRPGLLAVLSEARLTQQDLQDVWELRVLQAPQPAVAAGPSRLFMVGGVAVLAAFGAVLLLLLLRRLGLVAEPGPPSVPREDDVELDTDQWTRISTPH